MDYQTFSSQIMKVQLDHAILDKENEYALLRLAQAGDRDAISEILVHNQRLVRSIAQRYYRAGMCGDQDLSDVIQWGNMGLMRAIEKWDEGRETRFSTYAVQWIRSFVRRWGIMKGSGVTVSFHASDMVTKVRRTRAKLNENLQREPTTEEISRKSGLSEFSVNSALVNQTTLISIDAPVNGQADNVNSTLLREILPDEANTEERAFRSLLVNHLLKSIYSMPKRMRTVILHRYGLDDHEVLTLDVLSKQFGVSKTTIQNDEKAAILELRNSLFSWIGLIS